MDAPTSPVAPAEVAPATPASPSTPAPTSAPAPAATPSASALESAAAEAPPAPPAESPVAPAPAMELKLPDGFGEVDAKHLDGLKTMAAELKLDAPGAQKMLDGYVALDKARNEALEARAAAQDAKWAAELAAVPEFSGAQREAAMGDVRRALQHFGAKDMAKALHAAGLGNHPALVKGFAAIGRALREDSIAGSQGAKPAPARLSDAEIFYGPATSPQKEH